MGWQRSLVGVTSGVGDREVTNSGKAGGRQRSWVRGDGGVWQGSAEESGMEWPRILEGVGSGVGDREATDSGMAGERQRS